MTIYSAPQKRIHKGFFYLDDETVINSLSAVEAGKVDEVVAKINSSRKGGFGGSAGFSGVGIEGGKELTSALEEEIVRTRTRFSVFEIWYENLKTHKALGTFSGWGPSALDGVKPGDTVEVRAEIEIAPLQVLGRLFMWFADQAKTPGNVFSQKGEALKATKESERGMRTLLGDKVDTEAIAIAAPGGDMGPPIGMQLTDKWLIGEMGQLTGEYTAVGQVDQIIPPGGEIPALRLTKSVPPTPLEMETLRTAVSSMSEAASAMGVELSKNEASLSGPALWLRPIAIFR